ncbi:uncharacterized protein [Rutidosis leptorrhynchoides]|uniref:uncharacterized protein n=1 Tax=Rutidosis leptorrhynchoides TaxID=125765 RepID=UPI003A98FD9A
MGGLGSSNSSQHMKKGSTWNGIRMVGQEIDNLGIMFTNPFVKEVNKGNSTLFWKDTWIGDQTLCNKFERLFRLEENGDALIVDQMLGDSNSWYVSWKWTRTPTGRTSNEWEELSNLISAFVFNCDKEDSWRCNLQPNGKFTTSTLRNLIDEKILPPSTLHAETMLNNLIPKKIGLFIWRASIKRLPVRIELDKWGIDLDSLRCPTCNNDVKSVEHVLLKCPFAKDVWDRTFRWWNSESRGYFNIDEMFKGKRNLELPSSTSKLWQAIEWVCGYIIWQKRNEGVFQKKKANGPMTLHEIQVKSFELISNRSRKLKLD